MHASECNCMLTYSETYKIDLHVENLAIKQKTKIRFLNMVAYTIFYKQRFQLSLIVA